MERQDMGRMTSSSPCECCLAEDALQELDSEYVNRGAREIYSKMLLDCFGVKLAAPGGAICAACVRRLREACSFKRLVVSSQKMLAERRVRAATLDDLKQEPDSDCSYYDFESDTPDAYPSDKKVTLVKREPIPEWSSDDDALLSSVKQKRPNYERKVNTKRPTLSSIKMKIRAKRKLALLEVSKKSAFAANSTTIITCSSATPFNGNTPRGFRCFYCTRCFPNPQALREHTLATHSDEQNLRILSKFSSDNYMVYLDITDLTCKLCRQPLTDLNALRTHLTAVHTKKLHPEHKERDIPFKLTVGTMECQRCDQKFETFGSLERHMNIHYRHYQCDECDAAFITKRRLYAHSILSHSKGSFPCSCGKTYSSRLKLKLHEEAVHKNLPRFKCPQCPERFFDYYKRQAHLVSVHNAPPLEYRCNMCERVFGKRSGLTKHTKKFHMQERNFQCEMCTYSCFTSHELKVHMIKHTGQRVHACEVCKKSYARLKTLKEHMRIHNNDRRFACNVCEQTFVQKCSLTGHLKTHHSDLAKDNILLGL